MNYYSLANSDTSAYGDTKLPTLPNTIIEAAVLGKDVEPYGLDYDTILSRIGNASRVTSGVYNPDGSKSIDTRFRSSEFCAISKELYETLKTRLTFAVNHHVNQSRWKLAEPIQILCYDSKNSGHFSMHTDSAYWSGGKFIYTSPHRKLTTITYLNDDYEGGELTIRSVKTPEGATYKKKMTPGTMVIFPSDTRYPHEVSPVTSGQRFSIVAWFDYN